jgi:hypothetical protein
MSRIDDIPTIQKTVPMVELKKNRMTEMPMRMVFNWPAW